MITDEMRAKAPICPVHNERMSLWLCEPMGYVGESTISAECYWCISRWMDAQQATQALQIKNSSFHIGDTAPISLPSQTAPRLRQ